MADVVDKATRSRMMSGIRGKHTQPELKLRRALHAMGFRYRLHAKHLPGSPDLVLPSLQAIVFVHGCFWHRHVGCRFATNPSSNSQFWASKFAANVERDTRNEEALSDAGWRIAVVWECALRGDVADSTTKLVARWLSTNESRIVLPSNPSSEKDVRAQGRP